MSDPHVHLSWDLSREAVENPQIVRLTVLVRLRADPPETSARAPLNLSLVLDRSGSMQGAKMEHCKRAAGFAISHLAAVDRASVVTFDAQVEVVVPHRAVDEKEEILAALDPIRPRSTTNLSGGWLQGASFVEEAREEGSVNRVLLLTDGLANEGVTDSEQLAEIAQALRSRGVQTTCIGFGADFAEDLLRALADAGGGNFHYIRTPEEAPAIFGRELAELLAVAAQNVRLRVAPGRGVTVVGVVNPYPLRAIDGGLEVDMGDLLMGDTRSCLIQLEVRKGSSHRTVSVLTVSYHQIVGGVAFKEIDAFVEAPEGGAESIRVNPVVWREVLLGETAREMKAARDEADKGRLDAARERLQQARRDLASSPFGAEPEFKQQQHELDALSRMLVSQDDYRTQGRKSLTYSSVSLGRGKLWALRSKLWPPAFGARFIVAERIAILTDRLWEGRVEIAAEPDPTTWRAVLEAQMRVRAAGPTQAHRAVARLGARWKKLEVITTACDGLHTIAGSVGVIEVRGSIWRGLCLPEGRELAVLPPRQGGEGHEDALAIWREDRPCCPCGAPLRPSARAQDEPPRAEMRAAATRAADEADIVIVAGSLAPHLDVIFRARDRKAGILCITPQGKDVPEDVFHLPMAPLQGLVAIEREVG
jgi:Ca-activated chloride channel family protein